MPQPFIGEIKLFAGDYAPKYWALCNGQELSMTEYSELYSLIQNTYGGNGTTTFALPDLRGRVLIGAGRGFNLTLREVGEKTGQEAVRLDQAQMPEHTHAVVNNSQVNVSVTTESGLTDSPVNAYIAAGDNVETTPAHNLENYVAAPSGRATLNRNANSISGTTAVENTGDNIVHENRQPYTVLNYIIALYGEYPSRP